MTDWNAALYLKFEDERSRPARDLLAQVPLSHIARAVDLGCGPGNSTELIAARFAEATIIGIDMSNDMLDSARKRLPGARFDKADIAHWASQEPVDLILANAALQWVPNHAILIPHLLDQLAPGGVLAIQMPDNLDEPSHRLMNEVAKEGPWAARLAEASTARARLLSVGAYYDLLAPQASVDIWRTVYHHPLENPAAIATWLRSTGLKPFIDPLGPEERAAFLAAYEAKLSDAYPLRANGRVILTFPRLFIVAQRKI